MDDLTKLIDDLSPEKQELLEMMLQEEGSLFNSFPLSFAQQRLWFLDHLDPASSLYNLSSCIKLTGPLDFISLRSSFNEVVRRHESLRTSFTSVHGQALQVISPSLVLDLPLVDLQTVDEGRRRIELDRLIHQQVHEPFNLQQAPLLRVMLIRHTDDEHILMMTMHHIVSDGWSMGVIIKEVATLYEAYLRGEQSPLKELSIQYADYAQWQREWLESGVLGEQLSYWKRQLEGAPEVLEVPTDKVRPAINRYRGGTERFRIGREETRRLKEIGEQEGATMFMVMLGGFKVLLSKYTGEEDVVVGTAIAGRNREELEELIGFFVNTLVMRTDLRGEPSFREVVRRVKEAALGGYGHQDLPFEKLVEEIEPERDLSRSPVFQVYFVYQNLPDEKVEVGGVEMERLESPNYSSKFDLMLMANEREGEIVGVMEYNTDLYEARSIRRMIGHMEEVVRGVGNNPDRPVTRIGMLSERERRQITEEWNDTQTSYPEMFIHDFIGRQARLTPDATAVVFEDHCLSYGELNSRANQLAHYLRAEGVGAESIVGVCLERSLEMMIGLVAIIKAGGAYLPLDPDYPAERLSLMMQDSATRVIVSVEAMRERLPDSDIRVVMIDREWGQIGQQSQREPDVEMSGENLSYVIYTSGSTGKPKAAMNTHAGISNRLQWMQRQYGLTEEDVVMQKTPYSFDVSVWELFWALMYGAKIVMARPGGHRDSRYIVGQIVERGVTLLHFVPAMLRVFVEEEGVEQCQSVRRVMRSE